MVTQKLSKYANIFAVLLLALIPAGYAQNAVDSSDGAAQANVILSELQEAMEIGNGILVREKLSGQIISYSTSSGLEWELVPVGNEGIKYIGRLKASPKSAAFVQSQMTVQSHLPDLVPGSEIVVTPFNPKSKERVDLYYTTVALGTVDVTKYFETWLRIPNGDSVKCWFDGLQAPGWGWCTGWMQGFGAGSYTLKQTVDATNSVSESSESNNVLEQGLTIRKWDQDLVVEKIFTEPEYPKDNGVFSIEFHVRNIGKDHIKDSFKSTLYIDNNKILTFEHGSGAPSGQLQKFTSTGNQLSAGAHKIRVVVDEENKIEEVAEGNNQNEIEVNVIHVRVYDLAVTKIYTVPEKVDDATTFELKWDVKNVGQDFISSEDFESRTYINGVRKSTCRMPLVDEGLYSGSTYTCSYTGQKWAAGDYTVKADVELDATLADIDESNNELTKTISVLNSCPADHPYFCSSASACLEKQEYCDGRPVYQCGGSSEACVDRTEAGTCAGGKLYCCPASQPYYWVSDGACHSCSVADGSSASCDCNSNNDCPADYYCKFSSGYDACAEVTCTDECSTAGYYCSSGDVYECGNFDSDSCYERKLADICSPTEACTAGESSCQTMTAPVKVYAEDSQSDSITVYKQPGDFVELTINSGILQNAQFSAPEQFNLVNGICSSTFSISPGDTKCVFEISEDTPLGNYYLTVNGKSAKISVIDNPKMIIVTSKANLYERFPDDKNGVNALLKQAFQYAEIERNTVVYYLDREISEHPFTRIKGYIANILNPPSAEKANAYSTETAKLIREKCGTCQNIIILGDDFVVPFYRVDYATAHSWWKFWADENTETNYIYSDQPYITEQKKTLGEIDDLFDSNEVDKIIFVAPDTVSTAVNNKINELQSTITTTFGYENGDMEIHKSNSIGCNSYSKLDDATLILIGNRDNNNAIKCVPWFDIGEAETDTFKASIEIERNVWANDDYAIIVSGDNIESGLGNLITIIKNPDYFAGTMLGSKNTVYIHDFSNPPPMPPDLEKIGSHIIGFALGTCEEGNFAGEKGACIATDLVAGVVPPADIITDGRDVVLYCPAFIWNKATGQKGELFDGLACGGSAAGTGITVGKYVTAVSGVGAVAGTVADAGSTSLKIVLKVVKSSLGSGADRMLKVLDKMQLFKFENARTFFKAGEDESTWSNVNRFVKITTDKSNARYINKYTEYFDDDTLAATIKNVDDYEGMAAGTKRVLANFQGGLEEFGSSVKVCSSPCRAATKGELAENVKSTGQAALKGMPTVKLSELPKEADDTVKLIEKGGPFPYPKHDGKIFENKVPVGKKEPLLPDKSEVGYYKEYTVETPGAVDRAKRRIVAGKNGEIYYTDDHFDNFKLVMKNGE